jgi:uncharacterized protein YgiM (DUF1202 family)
MSDKMAVIKIGYTHHMLPIDKAVKVAEMLSDAEAMETDYHTVCGYKFTTDAYPIEIKVLSTRDRGELELLRD